MVSFTGWVARLKRAASIVYNIKKKKVEKRKKENRYAATEHRLIPSLSLSLSHFVAMATVLDGYHVINMKGGCYIRQDVSRYMEYIKKMQRVYLNRASA